MSEELLRYSRLVRCAITNMYMEYCKEQSELLQRHNDRIEFLKMCQVQPETLDRELKIIEELYKRSERLSIQIDILANLRNVFDSVTTKLLLEEKESEVKK